MHLASDSMWTAQDREIHEEVGGRYPSDLSGQEWALAARFFAGYRPVSATIREIVQACLYVVAEGCRWRALPKDFPPWQTVRWWWDRFRREGVWECVSHALTSRARAIAGRAGEPRTGLIDTQGVRCGPQRGARGWDGGKKLNGRKRHVLTCSAGFLLAALVTAASVHDKHGVDPLLARSHAAGWNLRRLVGDGSYAGEDVLADAARHGASFVTAARPEPSRGFVPIPLRWRVEQGLGILTTRNRRLVRDWEQLPDVSETMPLVANLRRLIRLIARAS
jgi:putative transposase